MPVLGIAHRVNYADRKPGGATALCPGISRGSVHGTAARPTPTRARVSARARTSLAKHAAASRSGLYQRAPPPQMQSPPSRKVTALQSVTLNNSLIRPCAMGLSRILVKRSRLQTPSSIASPTRQQSSGCESGRRTSRRGLRTNIRSMSSCEFGAAQRRRPDDPSRRLTEMLKAGPFLKRLLILVGLRAAKRCACSRLFSVPAPAATRCTSSFSQGRTIDLPHA